ncbi:MoaD/ThiS family protein [Pseudohalocynthiibacter sp. F2068]|uniref:MoaD/ThiS family protein n=1 Tax=Pseudohalocynthiibacter sp. F2068 TaxID=2926418 RepID=UPI001FF30051|nr:MoaD/ThiS family protein [Pseudohalocynthiibacter sp. F2068]
MPKVQIMVSTVLANLLPDGENGKISGLDLPEGASIFDVLQRLNFTEIQKYLVTLNGQMLVGLERDQALVREGDVIGVFPPLKGG